MSELRTMLSEVLAPLIEADGGELYLVSASKKEVCVHLAGSYAGCPGSTLAARHVLEPAVHKAAPKATLVVTHGWIIPENAERLPAR